MPGNRPRLLDDKQKERVIKAYQGGIPFHVLARRFSVPPYRIRETLEEAGVEIRRGARSHVKPQGDLE